MASPSAYASIIIVTYGQRAVTERCLRSLELCLGERLGHDWELVLIDNNSPDDTPELLRSWSDRAVVRLLDENRNFAGGCNTGAEVAHGRVLIFLNGDTEVTPGALETIADQALEPGVAIAGARLLFPDRTLQHAGVIFVRFAKLGGVPMPAHAFYCQDQDNPLARASYELDAVTAACMAVRAEAFRAVGGFDQDYINDLEDIDLCLRIRLGGERVVYRGDTTVIHYEGATRGRGEELLSTPERIAAMSKSRRKFLGRWAELLDQDDELVGTLWDACLRDPTVARVASEGDVVVAGAPGALGSAADESRALLGILAEAGMRPTALERPTSVTAPRLSPAPASTLEQAFRRRPSQTVPWLCVPAGDNSRMELLGVPAIVRVARSRTAVQLDRADYVWASAPAIAADLHAAGIERSKLAIVAPPVLPAALGPGGAGVLAILPAHDRVLTRSLLAALRSLPAATAVRLLPTVAARGLAPCVAEALPGAELLAPCSDEGRFAKLAATADVLVAIDPDDRFERRALVGAGVGATPVCASADGPAAWVLGEHLALAGEDLAGAVKGALERSQERAALAAAISERCAPARVIELLERCRGRAAALL
jgi:GT2 family glycosyltransferase